MSYSPNGVDPNSSYQGLSEDAERVFRRGWLQPAMSVALRYGLAFGSVGAIVLAQTFLYYGLPQPFTALAQLFTAFALSAIAGAFWYGGTKPGILAALISWLVLEYFESEVSAESPVLYGLVFLVFALVMTLIMRWRNELEARVAKRTAELTKTNDDLRVEIARHKATEQALRRSEAYLAEAQRLSHTGTWALNKTTALYWSEESYRIWGLDPRQGLPSKETMWQRLHPDDRGRAYEEVQEALRQKRDYAGEFRILLPDGTVKYLQATSHHVFSESGDFVEVVGTHVDVTKRKHAEEAIRQNEAKIRRLVDANIIGIFIWDFEGRIIEANDAFLCMVDYDREDLVSGRMRWTELTPPEWLDRDERLWLPELRVTGSLQPFEKEYFRKDGSRIPVLIGVATFESGGNQGVAFVLDLTERKHAEQALRESEYKLRQIVETVPSLVWSLAPDGEPTHFNQRLLAYFGKPFEDFKDGGWEAFVHPDDRPETEKAFSHGIQTGTSYQIVNRLRRADGGYRWHHTLGEPLRDRQGRIVQWYGVSVDIDEGKRAEDLLRRSEAYLAEAQRLSHTGSAAFNDTTILYWSDETYRILEFDPRKGLPSREAVLQRIHPDDRERVREEAWRAVRQKKDYKLEYRIVLPAGTIKHIEMTAHPKFSVSGELVEVVSTLIDVTERKRAEEGLRESEAKFRDYAETASDWFWETGPDYKFTLLTENAFGSDTADRIGTPCWDHAVDLEMEPEKWRLVRETLDSRKPFRDFVYCTTGDNGSPMYVRASGKPVFDTNGEFRGYRGTGTDVTAIMRAHRVEASLRTVQAELAHASRVTTLGQLTASIAHEITQPIAAARNNARAAANFFGQAAT